MDTFASGKALLVITHEGTQWNGDARLSIHSYIQSCTVHGTGERYIAMESVQELFNCAGSLGWFNEEVRKMKEGDTWRVYVVYDAQGERDYWGEYDEDLIINKWVVRRKQKAKEYYECK